MLIKKVILDAADLLEKGFCKGVLAETEEGICVQPSHPLAVRYCARGALMEACKRAGLTTVYASEYNYSVKLAKFIKPNIFTSFGADVLVEWNNAPERTKEEVVAKFREFAETL